MSSRRYGAAAAHKTKPTANTPVVATSRHLRLMRVGSAITDTMPRTGDMIAEMEETHSGAIAVTAVDRPSTPSSLSSTLDMMIEGTLQRWLLAISLGLGVLTVLPWLAPVFMQIGWRGPARLIYFVYSFLCHQLPERSWFLFGPRFTLSLAEIQAVTGTSTDPFILRRFVGTPALGWKLAWSDRMVSFFGGLFLFALLYGVLRGWRSAARGLHWRLVLLLVLPMVLDGSTHMLSDLWGVTGGFRESNAWLAALTGNVLPPMFYAGDAWGSFNSLARLVTGLLAALGIVFWLFPWLDRTVRDANRSATEMGQIRG